MKERRNCSRCRRRAKTIDSFLCSISTTGLTKSDKDEGNKALSVYIGIGWQRESSDVDEQKSFRGAL